MVARVVVASDWDAQLLATLDSTPAYSHAVVLTWEDFPDVEGGVPGRLALPLALAMTAMGEVCFRLTGDVPTGARSVGRVKAARSPFAPAWTVIGSRDPETVLTIFATGWAEGDQTALVGALSDDRARRVLGLARLNEVTLEEDELAFSAIVDGAGMVVAARDAARLGRALDCVERRCREASVAVCQ